MAKRILYSNVDANVLRSKESYANPTNGGRFTVLLDASDLSYRIFEYKYN